MWLQLLHILISPKGGKYSKTCLRFCTHVKSVEGKKKQIFGKLQKAFLKQEAIH